MLVIRICLVEKMLTRNQRVFLWMKNINNEVRISFPQNVVNRMRVTAGDPVQVLRFSPDYALKPFPNGIENKVALALALHGTTVEKPADGTIFIARKKMLTDAQEIPAAKANADSAAIAEHMPSFRGYFQGFQIEDGLYQRDPNLDPAIPFDPNISSFCLFGNEEDMRSSSNAEAHQGAVRDWKKWYDAAAIQKVVAWTEQKPDTVDLVIKKRGVRVLFAA